MSNPTGFIRAISLVALIAFLAGCDSTSGPDVCLAIAEPALSVTVENADTGEPLDDALVVAQEGSFTDSARTRVDDHTFPATLAHERAGTYEVTVEKAGFSPWNRSGVVVPEGRCGPETVELTAQLAPSSGLDPCWRHLLASHSRLIPWWACTGGRSPAPVAAFPSPSRPSVKGRSRGCLPPLLAATRLGGGSRPNLLLER